MEKRDASQEAAAIGRKLWADAEIRRMSALEKRYVAAPRMPPTHSQLREASGEQLCMCPPMGFCPLTATKHRGGCDLCNNPLISRYYPSDGGWWNVRSAVKDLRETLNLEDEQPAQPPPAVVPHYVPQGAYRQAVARHQE